MGDRLRAGMWPATQANSVSYPLWYGKWLTAKVRRCAAAGDQKQDGSFRSWINVWAADKTMRSLVNTCHSERFRDEYKLTHKNLKAVCKCPVLILISTKRSPGVTWYLLANSKWETQLRPGWHNSIYGSAWTKAESFRVKHWRERIT